MIKASQLTLFDLSPRNKNKKKIDPSKGGIAELSIRNFKGIEDITVSFNPISLLVGTNNSGKSTVLQAIRLFYYCISKCGSYDGRSRVVFKKQVMPFSDFTLIPAHDVKELITNGLTPSSRKYGIYLRGKLSSGQEFDFTIYSAYSTLFVILPGEACPGKMTKSEFDSVSRQPLYVPGFSGVVTKELLSTNRRMEESLGSGHHNEVLRNLILRLPETEVKYLSKILTDEFSVRFQGVADNPNEVEFLKASYREPQLRISLDIVSAGSGFLQVLQIITHALQSPSPILLLDEPDAHMHTQLQEHFINLLRKFSKDRKMQTIMASHSEIFCRTMNLSEIRLIDRKSNRSETFVEPLQMKSELRDLGVWPDEQQLTEALRTKRILLCESSPDNDLLCAYGRICNSKWDQIKKHYEVIETKGANDQIVARMQDVTTVLNKLLNNNVKIAYLRDRDLMCDERKERDERLSIERGLDLIITNRRNRESYLVEPIVVEKAVLNLDTELPDDWRQEGYVSNMVKKWCIEFCREQLNEIPPMVKEYNSHWLRNQFQESDYRAAETRLEAFIYNYWYSPLGVGEIPWKLMDGKGFLKYIRQRFQEGHIILTDETLLENLSVSETPSELERLVDIIKGWM